MKSLFFVFVVVFFTACSQSATSVFKKDPIYAQNLQYTKVAKVVKDDEVKVILNVTYLNSVDTSKWDNKKQNFLISVYETNSVESNEHNLTLEKKTYISKKEIEKSSELYKNIALKNKWAKYFTYSFEDIEGEKVNLIYTHPKFGAKTISFEKE